MEAQAALVWADGAVHLDAESAIDLDVAVVVKPRYTEHQDALGFGDALKNAGRDIFRMPLKNQTQRIEYFVHGLVKFGLGGVLGLYQRHDFVDVGRRGLDPGGGGDCTHGRSSWNRLAHS